MLTVAHCGRGGRWAGVRSVLYFGPVLGFCISSLAYTNCQGQTRAEPRSHHWRSSQMCGVNSTYVWLRLSGYAVSYHDVSTGIPVRENGSTLASMLAFVRGQGANATAVAATPEQLMRARMPVIAHLQFDGTSQFQASERGHFVVVLDANAESIRYVDGSTGSLKRESADRFIRNWSGVLLLTNGRGFPIQFGLVVLVSAVMVIGALLIRRRKRAQLQLKSS